MEPRRVALVVTKNPIKFEEIAAHLRLYGEECERVDAAPAAPWPAHVWCVLREQTTLVRCATGEAVERAQHLDVVEQVSVLEATFTKKRSAELETQTFTSRTRGYIDESRKRTGDGSVFGFDDCFVLPATGKTFHDLRMLGYKVSARNKAVVAFLKARLYYDKLVDLQHKPFAPKQVLLFAVDPLQSITDEPSYHGATAVGWGLPGLLTRVANEGVFFRSAVNRRERVYWAPGGNAGIPMVAKPKDPFHELVYRTHDLCHFLLPDLLFDGTDGPLERFVYVSTRLMSEATTIMLADGLYVHCLQEDGFDYTTRDARKIFPLVQATGVLDGGRDPLKLRALLMASMSFCLTGDTSRFRALVGDRTGGEAALADFVSKYSPFFVADFQWTVANWESMSANRAHFSRWNSSVRHLVQAASLQSVPDFIAALAVPRAQLEREMHDAPAALLDRIYAHLLDRNVLPFLGPVQPDTHEARLGRTAMRYFLCQLLCFSRHAGIVPQAAQFEDVMVHALTTRPPRTVEEVERMRR